MRHINVLTAAFIMLFAFASCGSDYGDILNGGGNLNNSNLPGTWSITKMTQNAYVDGVLEDSNVQENLGTLTFESDGSGTYAIQQEESTASGSFDWFEKNDKLFMNFLSLSEDIITDNFALAWDVVQNTSTTQRWSANIKQYVDNTDPTTGQTIRQLERSEIILDLDKN